MHEEKIDNDYTVMEANYIRKRKEGEIENYKTTMAVTGKGKRSETYNDAVVEVKGKRKEFALKTQKINKCL